MAAGNLRYRSAVHIIRLGGLISIIGGVIFLVAVYLAIKPEKD